MPTSGLSTLPPDKDWTDGVVAILKAGRPVGAGFIVTGRDGQPLILTCAHVLADAGWGFQQWQEPIHVRFKAGDGRQRGRAFAVAAWFRSQELDDLAVLRLDDSLPAGAIPLPLAPAAGLADEPVAFFGYPQDHDELRGQGQLLGPVRQGGRPRLQIESQQVTAGYSGGPVWVPARRQAVGLVLSGRSAPDSHGRLPFTAFAVPAEALAAPCPELVLAPHAGQVFYGVPELPPHFQSRPDDLAALRSLLLEQPQAVGIQGMGGIGKSVIAAALVRDEAVRAGFPDGIFWLTLGHAPNLVAKQAALGRAQGQENVAFAGPSEGRAALRGWLAGRRCLLVLDDVWQMAHAAGLRVHDESAGARLLLTSRDGGLLRTFGATVYNLDVLPLSQSVALLAQQAGQPLAATQADPAAQAVADECGHLPLALAIIGGMVRGKPDPWRRAQRYLVKQDLGRIREQFPDYPYPDLLRALAASVDALAQDEGLARLNPVARYRDLAVFPEDVPIPLAVLTTYWQPAGLDDLDVEDLVEVWIDRSLAGRDAAGRLTLHDLQTDYVRQTAADVPALQGQLLAAYAVTCDNGWTTGPDDGYFLDWLTYHLLAAGRVDETIDLLWTYDWLTARLTRSSVTGLLVDFERALARRPGGGGRWLQQALQLGGSILNNQPDQLMGQLLGRLGDLPDEDVQARLAQLMATRKKQATTAWLRPRRATLAAPGGPLRTTLLGHKESVYCVAITPDGQHAVSGAGDAILKVWDLTTNEFSHDLIGHSDSVNAVVITPDGSRVVSVGDDRTLKVWDLESGQLIHDMVGHYDPIQLLTITPDGRGVITASGQHEYYDGSRDFNIHMWDLATGNLFHILSGHTDRVTALAIAPDNRRAVSASDDGTVKVWDLDTGELIHDISAHEAAYTHGAKTVAVTPDGRHVFSGGLENTVKVWDLASGQLLAEMVAPETYIQYIAIPAAGGHVVAAAGDNNLYVWDLANKSLQHTLIGHTGTINGVAITPDGQRAVSIAEDGTLKVWDLADGSLRLDLMGHAASVYGVAFTPDGQRAISAGEDTTLKVWDLAVDQYRPQQTDHADLVCAIVISPDGRHAISASVDHTLKVWDLATGWPNHTLKGHSDAVFVVAITPDGQRAISGADDSTLIVWDLATGRPVHTLTGHTSAINAIVISADGRQVISADKYGTFKVWDLATGALTRDLTRDLQDPLEWMDPVAITPDGRRAVSAAKDNSLKVWDLATGTPTHGLQGHFGLVNAIAITPDGRRVVSLATDQTCKVWDLESGRLVHDLGGAVGDMVGLALTPDGRYAVAGTEAASVKVWDVESGRLVYDLTGHTNGVLMVAVSPDGRYAVSGSVDYTLKVWDLTDGTLCASFVTDAVVGPLAVAPDGRTIVAGDLGGQVHLLELMLPKKAA